MHFLGLILTENQNGRHRTWKLNVLTRIFHKRKFLSTTVCSDSENSYFRNSYLLSHCMNLYSWSNDVYVNSENVSFVIYLLCFIFADCWHSSWSSIILHCIKFNLIISWLQIWRQTFRWIKWSLCFSVYIGNVLLISAKRWREQSQRRWNMISVTSFSFQKRTSLIECLGKARRRIGVDSKILWHSLMPRRNYFSEWAVDFLSVICMSQQLRRCWFIFINSPRQRLCSQVGLAVIHSFILYVLLQK